MQATIIQEKQNINPINLNLDKHSTKKSKNKTSIGTSGVLVKLNKIIDFLVGLYDTTNKNFIDNINIKHIRIILKGIMGILLFSILILLFIVLPVTLVIYFWRTVSPVVSLTVLGIIFVYFAGYKLDKTSNKKHKEVNKNGRTTERSK